jgi:hypothetical protein
MMVLLTSVMVTMDMLNTVTNSVSAQAQEFEQALPALAPLQNLVRAEVEPAPPATNGANQQLPSPGFQPIGNFSLTFYADIGTAYNNVTSLGTTGGPVKVVAQEVDANGNAVTSSTTCSTTSPCSFQVMEYLPQIISGVSTCPIADQGGTACTYGATGTGKLLVNVVGVTNNPNSSSTIQPIFTYNVFNPTAGIGCTLTSTCSVTPNLTSNVPSSGNGSATACQAQVPSGIATVAQTCNDYIQSVGVELMVARKGAGTNGTVDEQTVVYRYAQSSGASYYPYQPSCFYDASVSCPS